MSCQLWGNLENKIKRSPESPAAAAQGAFFPSYVSFLPEGNVLLQRPCIQSTLLDAPILAGCHKARLMLSSQVWVLTIFILDLLITWLLWLFCCWSSPLAQDLAPLLTKVAPYNAGWDFALPIQETFGQSHHEGLLKYWFKKQQQQSWSNNSSQPTITLKMKGKAFCVH